MTGYFLVQLDEPRVCSVALPNGVRVRLVHSVDPTDAPMHTFPVFALLLVTVCITTHSLVIIVKKVPRLP